ncbi:helix-turn-helix transcriptional regulator [Parvibaculaceae bacterium PLY_AMNH_Bact1]|nr:helix-turn-helix transcriptional regulator [Parvibaculaceae bacterium PLY_AMNH_Bact1]
MKSFHTQEYADLIQGLIEARKNAGLTQQEVADALGKPQSYVAKIEGCERRLDIAEFVEYVRYLGSDPADLLREMLKDAN